MLLSASPNGLMASMQRAWATYFSKFIDAYASFGVKMWGLTTQNEPLAATNLWQSMFKMSTSRAILWPSILGP